MNLNDESKKKASYRTSGILLIPKDVLLILAGILLAVSINKVLGICAIGAGILSLLVSISYLKMGKDDRK